MLFAQKSSTPIQFLIVATAMLSVFAGCKKSDPDPTTADGAVAGAAVTGESLFRSNCSNCHAINGRGGKRAPDLSNAGGDSKHTELWLTDFIKDPKSKNPNSKMPPQGERLKDEDMKKLTTYLLTLKVEEPAPPSGR